MLNSAMASAPWLILEDDLKTIISISKREHDANEFRAYAESGGSRGRSKSAVLGNGTALVPITGPIFRHANIMTEISGATSADAVRNEIKMLAADETVKRIVFDIDSPGGQVNGIHELTQTIKAIGKPTVAHISGTGASAAYWIASAADTVTASKTAVVGSIGAVLEIRIEKNDNAEDITIVSSVSPNKRIDPTTEDGKAQLQTLVDDMGAIFVSEVAQNRGITEDEVLSKYGKGAVMVAEKALEAGMVDKISSLDSILGIGGERGGIMVKGGAIDVLNAKLKLKERK